MENNAREFKKIGIASVIYAIVFVVCLYQNYMGITSPVWAAVTVAYMYYAYMIFGGRWTRINTFMSSVIILSGLSNFLTSNYIIVFLNYCVIWVLIVVNVVTIFIDTTKVNVSENIKIMVKAVLSSVKEWGMPITQMIAFVKESKIRKSQKVIYVFIGVLISIPLLLFLILILASADSVFAHIFKDMEKFIRWGTFFEDAFFIIPMAVAGFILPYSFIISVKKRSINVKAGKSWNGEPIIATIVTGTISVVYVIFSMIQIYYLFLGNGTLPEGYTYAEYAREGFFQLMFVSMLNMVIVLGSLEFFKDSKVLHLLLTVVSGCTFIMIASSAYRMGMYIREYGLTFTRFFVLWLLLVITSIMIGLVVQIYKRNFNLFRYCVIVVSVCFIGLSLSHIDYFIAKYNLAMYSQNKMTDTDDYLYSEYVDYDYLFTLSLDAAPAFIEYEDDIEKRDVYFWYFNGINEEMSFRDFNLSNYIAIEIMKN